MPELETEPDRSARLSPELSIIIPCRNEERFIAGCLDSILAQDYPRELMEVIVADGMSDDATRQMVSNYSSRHRFIRLVDNPKKIVPTALNAAIRLARGQFIMRLDAHNEYPADYISKCVGYLKLHGVDNVGGVWEIVPGGSSALAKAIALAVSSPFGAGNARYKTGAERPMHVDTVPFGCYRRDVFERIGLFDEDLVRNQDDELNQRLIKSGGKIMLCPDITSRYHARDSLRKLGRMYFQYGYFKPLVALKIGRIGTLRQLAPLLFLLTVAFGLPAAVVYEPAAWGLGGLLLAYLLSSILLSGPVIGRRASSFVVLPVVYAVIHFSYGLGYLKGGLDFLVRRRHHTLKVSDFPLSR